MPTKSFLTVPLIAALALSACADNKDNATKVSINAEGEEGTTTVTSADGKVRVIAPGTKIEIDNPGINLTSDDFDIGGVELYKGSTIKTMNVDAAEKNGVKDTSIKVGFESPTDAKTLADWFEKEMKAKGFATTRSGYDISGKTKDGDAFTLKIGDMGGSKASGLVTITGD